MNISAPFEELPTIPPTIEYHSVNFNIFFYQSLQLLLNVVYYNRTTFFDCTTTRTNVKILFKKYNPNWASNILNVFVGAIGLTVARILYGRIVLRILYKHKLLTSKNATRFMESFYQFTFYTLASIFAFWIERSNGYLTNPERLWIGFRLSDPIPIGIQLLYLFEASHYVHSFFGVLLGLNGFNQKERMLMFVHHIVALGMLALGHFMKVAQIAVPLLCLLDSCDVLIEGFKCLLKLDIHIPIWVKAPCFGTLFVQWFAFRLYLFPIRAIYPSMLYMIHNDIDHWVPGSFVLLSFSWLIFVMNAYWGFLLIKIMYNAIVGGEKNLEDIRVVEKEKKKHGNSKFIKKKFN